MKSEDALVVPLEVPNDAVFMTNRSGDNVPATTIATRPATYSPVSAAMPEQEDAMPFGGNEYPSVSPSPAMVSVPRQARVVVCSSRIHRSHKGRKNTQTTI